MVRTSQCFRTEFSQLDGPSTLAAAEILHCALVLSACLIKPYRGVYPLDFSRRRKWHFLVSSLRSARMKACQIICFALRFRQFRRQCTPLLRPLQGFGKQLSEVTRESKFRPHTQGRTLAALSVTAS
jgi:hypothetical protein